MTNEQKYKTPEERVKAFCKWCFNRTCDSCKLKSHNFDGGVECKFYWLALEAEEDEPEPCPFCGGMTEVITDEQGYYGVSCIHCGYTSESYEQSIYAIAAHNRVARAVEAMKKGDMK